jgi:ATP-dependent DNA ligase
VDSFASVADAVAATTKKLEKRSILAAYLRGLGAAELPVAAVFLTGRPFPLRSEQTLQVGGAALQEAVTAVAGITPEALADAFVRLGDAGEAAAEALASREPPSRSMTLMEAREMCGRLASAAFPAGRRDALAEALARCRPAAAKYVVKIITGGMRIGVQESLVEEALAEAFGRRADEVRWANMLLGDIGETALLAREGRLDEARLQPFRPVKFMLATAIDEAEEAIAIRPAWEAEDKYDGIRAQVHSDGRAARVYSRTLDEVTHQFPEVAEAFVALGKPLICDGEILAQEADRQLGFAQLSRRLGRKEPDETIRQEVPVVFVAFDLLALDGEPLLREPLGDRRARLAALIGGSRVAASRAEHAATAAEVQAAFEAALARGNEGLVLKDPGSVYQPGKRGQAWLKLKRPLATLDVVIVAAEYGHGKRAGLLSDYTFAVQDAERLAPVGKAYSGVTDAEIASLTKLFLSSALRHFRGGVVVPPTVVVEIAFNGIQRSARHPSGFALRFPRIKRLRLDKPVSEIDTLARVEELWARQNRRQEAQAQQDGPRT